MTDLQIWLAIIGAALFYFFMFGVVHERTYQNHRATCPRCKDNPKPQDHRGPGKDEYNHEYTNMILDTEISDIFWASVWWPVTGPAAMGRIVAGGRSGVKTTKKQAREILQAEHMVRLAEIHLLEAQALEAAAELNPLTVRRELTP